ncbi:unnamed protein product, partial [marine sediment metagenome]
APSVRVFAIVLPAVTELTVYFCAGGFGTDYSKIMFWKVTDDLVSLSGTKIPTIFFAATLSV